jgi:hypothetical protein
MDEKIKRVAMAIEDQMASDENHLEGLARAVIAAIEQPSPLLIEMKARNREWARKNLERELAEIAARAPTVLKPGHGPVSTVAERQHRLGAA